MEIHRKFAEFIKGRISGIKINSYAVTGFLKKRFPDLPVRDVLRDNRNRLFCSLYHGKQLINDQGCTPFPRISNKSRIAGTINKIIGGKVTAPFTLKKFRKGRYNGRIFESHHEILICQLCCKVNAANPPDFPVRNKKLRMIASEKIESLYKNIRRVCNDNPYSRCLHTRENCHTLILKLFPFPPFFIQ